MRRWGHHDDVDVWPAFVDLMTSAIMFLLLGFIALTLGQFASQKALRDARVDRLARDQRLAATIGDPVVEALDVTLSAAEGADCRRNGWTIECTFQDKLTFETSSWVLRSSEAQAVLRRFGSELKRFVDRGVVEHITVEGHTDPRPLRLRDMTNWELSSARAGHIVRFLTDETHIQGDKLIAIGFAEFGQERGTSFDRMRFVRIRVRLAGSILERGAPQP